MMILKLSSMIGVMVAMKRNVNDTNQKFYISSAVLPLYNSTFLPCPMVSFEINTSTFLLDHLYFIVFLVWDLFIVLSSKYSNSSSLTASKCYFQVFGDNEMGQWMNSIRIRTLGKISPYIYIAQVLLCIICIIINK